jgi:hypothetical protein
VDYARWYGESIGLIYEKSIGDGGWNAPLNLYPGLSEDLMKSGIRTSCDRLKREEAEYFWVFAERRAENDYRMYIYYG